LQLRSTVVMGNTGSSSKPRNKVGARVVAQKLATAQKTNILSLTECKIEEIPPEVSRLTSLRTLDLSKNKIQNLGRISQLKELKSLNCDENALSTRSLSTISGLDSLTTLSVAKNRLISPADNSFPSIPPKLKTLKLPGNKFTSVPKQICSPKLPLQKLDLSNNNLAFVPPEIGNLVLLAELLLDSNVIVSLPSEMGKLKALKSLSLKNNHIQVNSTQFSEKNPQPIPAGLFVDTLLIDLNLHGNDKLTSTELNQFCGFDVFLKRRKTVKDKNLHGGAMVDMSVCGLK